MLDCKINIDTTGNELTFGRTFDNFGQTFATLRAPEVHGCAFGHELRREVPDSPHNVRGFFQAAAPVFCREAVVHEHNAAVGPRAQHHLGRK